MTETAELGQAQSERDKRMMRRCIDLSAEAIKKGEFPFAAVVARGDEIVVEAINEVARDGDVTRHAELVAISRAQQVIGHKDLSDCTLYTTVEPCPMCSFPMRETRIGRVVFAIGSPIMGGYSRWNVLRDADISRAMPEAFGPVPEVITGLLRKEAEKVWWRWNPLIWSVIKYRGCFGEEPDPDEVQKLAAGPERGMFLSKLLRRRHNHRA
jgi:tRNA(adenine34) deaminase